MGRAPARRSSSSRGGPVVSGGAFNPASGKFARWQGPKTPFHKFFETPAGVESVRAMERRVGETLEQRLRWVVEEFVRKDLDVLRPEERVALGYDLRWIAAWSLSKGAGGVGGLNTTITPMADEQLRRYQRTILTSVRALLARNSEAWPLPAHAVLAKASYADAGFSIVFEGGEDAGVIGAVANLILQAGKNLRLCDDPRCVRPFAARENRQRYCSPACSQRVRNRKRKPRPRKRG